jgi:hypothetical protein
VTIIISSEDARSRVGRCRRAPVRGPGSWRGAGHRRGGAGDCPHGRCSTPGRVRCAGGLHQPRFGAVPRRSGRRAGGVACVVGSSGLTVADYAEIDLRAHERGVGVIAAGNFSVMAAILQHCDLLAARHLASFEVIDYASAEKSDVPGGTSRELAERIGRVRTPSHSIAPLDVAGPVEARGATVEGVQIHSLSCQATP